MEDILLSPKKWSEFVKLFVYKIWKTNPGAQKRKELIEKFFGISIKEFGKYKNVKVVKNYYLIT